jgi:hypothetical protein
MHPSLHIHTPNKKIRNDTHLSTKTHGKMIPSQIKKEEIILFILFLPAFLLTVKRSGDSPRA